MAKHPQQPVNGLIVIEADDDAAATWFWHESMGDSVGWFYANHGQTHGPFDTYDEAVTHWSTP